MRCEICDSGAAPEKAVVKRSGARSWKPGRFDQADRARPCAPWSPLALSVPIAEKARHWSVCRSVVPTSRLGERSTEPLAEPRRSGFAVSRVQHRVEAGSRMRRSSSAMCEAQRDQAGWAGPAAAKRGALLRRRRAYEKLFLAGTGVGGGTLGGSDAESRPSVVRSGPVVTCRSEDGGIEADARDGC